MYYLGRENIKMENEKMETKKTKRAVSWVDENGMEKDYLFEVGIIVNGSMKVQGRYYYISEDIKLPLIIIEEEKDSVIVHEALHATIDFFRTTGFTFNDLFDRRDMGISEDMFVYYHGNFVEEIKKALSYLS